MDTHRVHNSRVLSPPTALLPIQKTRVALLPLRLVLLRYNPELHIHLVFTLQSGSFRCVLLPFTWLTRECGHYMEK
jgi:hypothetical protein